MPIHMELVLLLQILMLPIAVFGNVNAVLHLASFVVTAIKNWGCLLSVKPAIDLSSVCRAQLMF